MFVSKGPDYFTSISCVELGDYFIVGLYLQLVGVEI